MCVSCPDEFSVYLQFTPRVPRIDFLSNAILIQETVEARDGKGEPFVWKRKTIVWNRRNIGEQKKHSVEHWNHSVEQ